MGTDKQEWPGKLIEEECVKNRGEGREKKEKKNIFCSRIGPLG